MRIQNNLTRSCLFGAGLFLAASAWGVQDVYLRAEKFTKQLPGGVSVEMWGFASTDASFNGGTPSSPGPEITVAPGETTLTIHLQNTLPEPVSIIIPGQPASLGDVVRNPDGRIRSFTKEAAANNGTQTYTWSNVRPGTYLYHSGSHPALQVQMGLYGALKKNAGAGLAYAGVPFANDLTLLFSEIDVDVHEAVRTNGYGPGLTISSMIHSIAEYFLINGEPYTSSLAPLPVGEVGETCLLRLINACADDRIPTLNNGAYLSVVAEDGQKYNYPKQFASVLLPALKTRDALYTPEQGGNAMLYDRRLGLANGTSPNGGMYRALAATTATPPNAPTGLSATPAGPVQINLAWSYTDSPVNPATSFTIERAPDDTFTTGVSTFNVNDGGARAYQDTTLQPSTTYFYRIAASGSGLTSPWSDPASATTPQLLPPARPIAGAGTLVTPASFPLTANLTWTYNANTNPATGFEVQTSQSRFFSSVVTTTSLLPGPNVTSFTDTLLKPGTNYFRVRSVNAAGTSTYSPTWNIVAPLLVAPTQLTVASTTSTSITLNWTDNCGFEQGFRVMQNNRGAWLVIATIPANTSASPSTTSYTVTGLTPNNTYSFRVDAYYGTGPYAAYSAVAGPVTGTAQ